MNRCRPRKIYQDQLNFTVHRRTHREGSDTAPTPRQTHCKSTPHPSFNLMFRKIQNVLVREPSLNPRAFPLLSQTSALAVGAKDTNSHVGEHVARSSPASIVRNSSCANCHSAKSSRVALCPCEPKDDHGYATEETSMTRTCNHSIPHIAGTIVPQMHLQRRKVILLATRIFFILGMATLASSSSGMTAEAMTPLERVLSTPKGQLENPYPASATIADEGYKIYRSLDCGGCHGGGGGGGMAAPLTNPIWIYGDGDDTLFRLITLGTGSLSLNHTFSKQGFVRKGSEAVVGPMPPYGEIIKSEDDLWKIIAWIRHINFTSDH